MKEPPHSRAPGRFFSGLRFFMLVVWGFAALALLMVRALHDQFDSDEFQHAHLAWLIAGGKVLYRDMWDHHGPLFAVLNSLLLRFSGAAPGTNLLLACRAGSVVATAGIGALTYALARLLSLSRSVSLGSAALALTLLFVQDKGAECRPDTWQNLLWLGGLALTVLHLRRRPGGGFLAGVLLGLAVLTNLKAALGPLAILLYLVCGGRLHRLSPRAVAGQLVWLVAGGTLVVGAAAGWWAYQGALLEFWHFNGPWNLLATQGEKDSGRSLEYLHLMLRLQAPFLLATLAGLGFAWRGLPRAEGGLVVTVALLTGLGWVLNNYSQYFLIFLPLWSVLAGFGASESLGVLRERAGLAGHWVGLAALLGGIGLLVLTAVAYTPLQEHPNLRVQKTLGSLLLRLTAREEPVGVIWDYCGGFVFNAPVQYYWAAEPAIGRAVARDTEFNPGGENPFGRPWVRALEAQQVRFIVGRENDLYRGLPASTQAYLRTHYRQNGGCLWQRRPSP